MSDSLPLSTTAQLVRSFLTRTGIHPVSVVPPLVLLAFAAVFEGLSMMLLIPLMKGIISSDFSFVLDLPILGEITRQLPSYFRFGNTWFVVLLVVLTFGASLLKIILQYLASHSIMQITREFEHRLRVLVFERFLYFGKFYYDSQNSGRIIQLITALVQSVTSILVPLQQVTYALVTLGIYLSIMFSISWELTVIVLAIFPASHYSVKWLINKMKRTSSDLTKYSLELGRKVSNMATSMVLTKSYNTEEDEKSQFTQLSNSVRAMQISIGKKSMLVPPIQETLSLFWLFVLVGVISLLLSLDETWDVAGYMVFLVILRRCSVQFGLFNHVRGSLAEISGTVNEIAEVFDDEGKFYVADGELDCPPIQSEITVSQLRFRYPDGVLALQELTLHIRKGEVTALVGHSGAGKSTLINLLMRFYDPPPASIFIDGTDIRQTSLKTWRKQIALVSQEAVLFHGTLRQNLSYGMSGDVTDSTLMEALRKARLEQLVERLPIGLSTEVGDRGVKLSGGEKQRVAIARAFLKQADILLLDEATSALDSQTENFIQEALEELMQGRTTLVIAHRLSTIKNANCIYVLENGQVRESGSLQTLLDRKGAFHQYWEQQKFF